MKACNIPDTCRRDQIEQYPDGPQRVQMKGWKGRQVEEVVKQKMSVQVKEVSMKCTRGLLH